MRDRLFTTHGSTLSEDDLRGIEYVYRAFFMFGPGIKYSPHGLTGGTVQPTYAALMAATDERGQALGFLGDRRSVRVREEPAEPQPDRAGRRQFRRRQGDPAVRAPI